MPGWGGPGSSQSELERDLRLHAVPLRVEVKLRIARWQVRDRLSTPMKSTELEPKTGRRKMSDVWIKNAAGLQGHLQTVWSCVRRWAMHRRPATSTEVWIPVLNSTEHLLDLLTAGFVAEQILAGGCRRS